jgi:hypothetical protein
MKENTLITRLNMFVNDVLDTFEHEQKPGQKLPSRAEKPTGKLNRSQRRDFSYYMPLLDERTKEMVGHLSDISDGGFKLDTRQSLPANRDFLFRLSLPNEIADKPFMVFGARSRWCRADPLDPGSYNVGFQLTQIYADDLDIFNRLMERYARCCEKKNVDLRRSNKW